MATSSGLWRLYRDDPFPRIQLLAGATVEERRESLAALKNCNILVVAGGLGNLDEAIPALAATSLPTIYVLGSSELSGRDATEAVKQAQFLAAGTSVHVLEKDAIVLQGVRFLGTTLWCSFDDWRPSLVAECIAGCPDFNTIDASSWWDDPFNCQQAEELCRQAGLASPASRAGSEAKAFHPAISLLENRKAVSWLNAQLDVPFDGATVVVSNNSPVRAPLQAVAHYRSEDVDPLGWSGRKDRRANARLFAQTNDLRWLLRRHRASIDIWMHGRVPAHSDVAVEGVRVVSRSDRCIRVDDDMSFDDIMSRSLARRRRRKDTREEVTEPPEQPNAVLHPQPLNVEAGLTGPLSKVLLPIVQQMKNHETAIRNAVPLTMSKSSIHRACIRRVIYEEMEGIARLAQISGAIEKELVASDDRFSGLTFLFNSVDAPRGYPTEMGEPKQYDYYAKADRLSAQVDDIESLPSRAAVQLALWCDMAYDVLTTLASDGIDAMVVRPPIAALRMSLYAASVEVVTTGDKDERLAILHRLVAAHPTRGKLQPVIRVADVAAIDGPRTVLLDMKMLKEITDNIAAVAVPS
ncbi:hypothetical protein A6V36_20770 [Paraburkholderia ginsengiterrae]|uniref:Uncharacterized protein n=1 Tax=Paraburkholderia ginsengiterrae TaxID=1462993 RepID=A0A1A9NCN4_9BURK|nr:hypothetical protein [Paraburkholderia ginsengiterrae]OAJ62800.1 hypothetical protein A6V36_20770 [Paraburkholderia ginsengiterrae]OAJ64461.1 hypothetical protein A6V37_19795 [Paraburkholderia ginsengiterrae]